MAYAIYNNTPGEEPLYDFVVDGSPAKPGEFFRVPSDTDFTLLVIGNDGQSLREKTQPERDAQSLDVLKAEKRAAIETAFSVGELRPVSRFGEQWPGGKDNAAWLVSVWFAGESTGDAQPLFPVNATSSIEFEKDDIGLIAQRVISQATQDEATRHELLTQVDAASDAADLAAITIPAAWM